MSNINHNNNNKNKNKNKCIVCNDGYTLRNDNICIKCASNCPAKCEITNITKCLSCLPRFYL
jgi:hypothetical protein